MSLTTNPFASPFAKATTSPLMSVPSTPATRWGSMGASTAPMAMSRGNTSGYSPVGSPTSLSSTPDASVPLTFTTSPNSRLSASPTLEDLQATQSFNTIAPLLSTNPSAMETPRQTPSPYVSPTGTVMSPGGTVMSPRGTVMSPRGTVMSPGGTVMSPGGTVMSPGSPTRYQTAPLTPEMTAAAGMETSPVSPTSTVALSPSQTASLRSLFESFDDTSLHNLATSSTSPVLSSMAREVEEKRSRTRSRMASLSPRATSPTARTSRTASLSPRQEELAKSMTKSWLDALDSEVLQYLADLDPTRLHDLVVEEQHRRFSKRTTRTSPSRASPSRTSPSRASPAGMVSVKETVCENGVCTVESREYEVDKEGKTALTREEEATRPLGTMPMSPTAATQRVGSPILATVRTMPGSPTMSVYPRSTSMYDNMFASIPPTTMTNSLDYQF